MNKHNKNKNRTAGKIIIYFLLAACIFAAGCKNPFVTSILPDRNKKPSVPGELDGVVTITGIFKIGETITIDTSGVTGGSGDFIFQWQADGVDIQNANGADYIIRPEDLGKLISCVITNTSATGQITATGELIPYTIRVTVTGETEGDSISFSDTDISFRETTALNGDLQVFYTVFDDKVNNGLVIQINGGPIPVANQAESGEWAYTIDPADAYNGVITINVSFLHTDLELDPIEFTDTRESITVTYGDDGNLFTNEIANTYSGSGVIGYTSLDEEVAAVDSDGVVTILKAGQTTILAEKPEDNLFAAASASYILIIERKTLTWASGGEVEDKTYDGTTNAVITTHPELDGILNGDTVSLTNGTAAFNSALAGNSVGVTASGYSIAGADAGNYNAPTTQPAFSNAEIFKKSLTITGAVHTKAYDGNTSVSGTVTVTLSGVLPADTANVSATVTTAVYTGVNAETVSMNITGVNLSGSASGNYAMTLPANGILVTGGITKANPTVNWPTDLAANEGEFLEDIILPGNGTGTAGSFSWTDPANSTLVGAVGTRFHNLTFTPTDTANYNTDTRTVAVTVGPPLASSLVITPSPFIFTGITYGDSQPAAETFTITNSGTAAASVSSITLGGANPGSYTLGGTLTSFSIPDNGGTANFTLRPNANIGAGTHSTTVIISYDGDATKTVNVTLNVDKKPVTITGVTAANKIYDGGTTATATGTAAISGNIDGANLIVSAGTAAFNTKDAGNGKTVTFSGYTLSGSAAVNYELSGQPANTTADITKLQLTIAAPSGSPTKVYDGNTNYTGAGITLGALTNLAGSDVVSAAVLSATYNNANVASATQITIVYSISGSDSGNYDPPANGTIAATITKANPTVTWPTNLTANEGETLGQIILPGNGSANITGSWSWTAGDTTSVGAEGSRSHSLTFTPGDSGNYNSASNTVTVNVGPPLTADLEISPSPVSFTSITYGDPQPAARTVTITNNGTAPAIVSGITLNGASPGSYTLGGTLNPTIGIGSNANFTVRPNANLPAGAHNAVITVTYNGGETITANVTLNVARKPVTITGLTAANKVYDGGTTATITGTAVISGNIDGANLTVSAGTAAFNTKDAGTGKTVTFSGYSLSGSAAANYELSSQPANTTADITKLQLTIAAPSGSPTKVYDGNTNYTGAGISLGALTNRAGSDVVSAAVQSATYNNANVASATQITIVYSISGADSGNYDPPVNGTIAASITARPLTITPNTGQNKAYNTSDPSPFTYSPSETPIAGNSFTGALSRTAGESVGTYPFTLGSLSAGSNYSLSLGGSVSFEITKAPGATVATAATENTKTENSITVNAAVLTPGTGQSIEYAISQSNVSEPGSWQTGLTFSSLDPSTVYYVWARSVSNTNYNAGAAMPSLAITTSAQTYNTAFTLNFNHLQDENSLLPWQITGGGSGVLTIYRSSGYGIDLELLGYPNISWEVDGVVKSTTSTITLDPADFTSFDEGSHILYVEVLTGGFSYGRSIQFIVAP